MRIEERGARIEELRIEELRIRGIEDQRTRGL
jgi:hypothetical protein